MKIVNTTPHNVNICDDNGDVINTFPKSPFPIRLSMTSNNVGDLDGIPLMNVSYGDTDLPSVQNNVFYIVSALLKQSFPDRQDLLVPHDIVRDNDGNIIGCKSFSI